MAWGRSAWRWCAWRWCAGAHGAGAAAEQQQCARLQARHRAWHRRQAGSHQCRCLGRAAAEARRAVGVRAQSGAAPRETQWHSAGEKELGSCESAPARRAGIRPQSCSVPGAAAVASPPGSLELAGGVAAGRAVPVALSTSTSATAALPLPPLRRPRRCELPVDQSTPTFDCAIEAYCALGCMARAAAMPAASH